MNPRAETDPIEVIGLNPRLDDLNGKTIGLYATFKLHWVLILEEVGKQLKERYPDIKLTRFQYTKDLNSYTQVAEVAKDPDVRPEFEDWLSGVDAVIVANADAGSCALYLTYNTTLVERLGKPVVMLLKSEFINISESAAELRGVPALRYVESGIPDISVTSKEEFDGIIKNEIPMYVSKILDQVIDGLTRPLTEAEKNPEVRTEDTSGIVFEGNIDQVNDFYYKKRWAYGMPVMPPTEEAVKMMLAGTDLSADHVVAKIPPMLGKATVEKIAVNAVMAGCLPVYMPVLIAAVEAMVDPRMWIEAYTCSVASWAPLLVVNGSIRNDLYLNSGVTLFSPYYKANAAIGHALGLIIMNIAGIRGGVEDMGILGHEGRFGMCIAENEEDNPWEPLHAYYGLDRDDSAVTLFWPHTRSMGHFGKDVSHILQSICDSIQVFGFDPGCALIMCPATARLLMDHGFTRKGVTDYIVEYARQPASKMNVRWMKGNNHFPPNVPLPEDPTRSARKFMSGRHLPIIVAGMSYSWGVGYYGGGGDHGGPITKKINLPKNWRELVRQYEDRHVKPIIA